MKFNKYNPFKWIKNFNDWLDAKNVFVQIITMLAIVFLIRTFGFGLYWVPTGSMEPTMLVGESFFADKFTVLFRDIKRGDIISMNAPTFIYSENLLYKLFQFYIYGPDNWTKRVIGIPGDHVVGKVENGKTVIYLNGEKLDEPYVNPYPIVYTKETSNQLIFRFPFFEKKERSAFKTVDPKLEITDPLQPFYKLTDDILLPNAFSPLIQKASTRAMYSGVTDEFDVILKDGEYWGMGDNRLGSYDSRGFGKINKSSIHGRIIFRLFSFDSPSSLIYDFLGLGNDYGWPIAPFIELWKKARSSDRWFSDMTKPIDHRV